MLLKILGISDIKCRVYRRALESAEGEGRVFSRPPFPSFPLPREVPPAEPFNQGPKISRGFRF